MSTEKGFYVTSLFYDGKLFQVGDYVSGEIEFLGGCGFDKYRSSGFINKIKVEENTVTNSLLLNHGITFSSVSGLSYSFEIDGKLCWTHEHKHLYVPQRRNDMVKYFSEYHNQEMNSQRTDQLLRFISESHNRIVSASERKNLGKLFAREFNYIFDYWFVCLKIRAGLFGEFQDNNQLSPITNNILRQHCGYDNNIKNPLYKLTCDNPQRVIFKGGDNWIVLK